MRGIFKFIKGVFSRFIPVFLIGCCWSCEDFLNELPDNRVEITDLDKAAQVLTNGYSVASYAFTDWMTDDAGYTVGTRIRLNHSQAFAWEDFTDGPDEWDTPNYFWFETYKAISHANEVLTVLDELPEEEEDDKERKQALRAEALLIRAYGHFMLVNLFAPHYDPRTSRIDLGIPYIKTPEKKLFQKYERLSVEGTYQQILSDLLLGLRLIDDRFLSNSGKYHFNKNAALAFAARVYLYRYDYNSVIDYASRLLGTTTESASNYVRDMTSIEYDQVRSSIDAYTQLYTSPDEPANLLLMRKFSLVQRPDFGHGPIDQTMNEVFGFNLFSGVDRRENPALVKGENGQLPLRYQSLFQRSSLNSDVGSPYHIALAFRGEEVLLNRAEAYTQLGLLDNAVQDLQVLIERRYEGEPKFSLAILREYWREVDDQVDEVSDQNLLFDYIFREKRKEFIVQGLRWFDIKRFGWTVVHDIVTDFGIERDVLAPDDIRKVMQLPQSAIDVGGLEPNPR